MANKNFNYLCQNCGASYGKWVGKCNDCNSWNTVELQNTASEYKVSSKNGKHMDFELFSDPINCEERIQSGIAELDRVLGGGFVPGSAILVGGDPGIGKSTLFLQLVDKLSNNDEHCAYISGEESADQIKTHASRLDIKGSKAKILSTTNINNILETIGKSKQKFSLIVIDSIQTMFLEDIPSSPGTVSQVRSTAYELITLAKRQNIIVVLIGHVTKDGQIAGPKLLEHMVDTVLYFEGERGNNFRILRGVKNRFGCVNEIGVFEMSEKGLVEVQNPSSLFLSERQSNISGFTIFASMEGTRPMLVEVQALVSPSHMASPRRAVVGWDVNRLSMMIAVLASRYGLKLHNQEVYLNIVGGFKVIEPAADLAVVCSLISAVQNVPMPDCTIAFGEVGLSGEVRRVGNINTRLRESAKLGFSSAIIPANSKVAAAISKSMKLMEVSHIKQLQNLFT